MRAWPGAAGRGGRTEATGRRPRRYGAGVSVLSAVALSVGPGGVLVGLEHPHDPHVVDDGTGGVGDDATG